jgi:hypothetical protein
MRVKGQTLVKAPVKQKISLETDVRSEVLDAIHRFHWVKEPNGYLKS